ncbi:Cation/calcium exchanger 4 [Striga hermonthica]|uniref:Cation/calcium exchanger 4 n=1 Tax=Striga hermonthica TaxID=68872 RepID=A0A9N7MI68_STRHE|nr:Cation/calcium exchanger 4 [Striga hermonthica]
MFCPRKLSKFRGSFNGLCFLILLFFLTHKDGIFRNPFSKVPIFKPNHPGNPTFRRRIYETTVNSLNFTRITNREADSDHNAIIRSNRNPTICTEIYHHNGYTSKCHYLKANPNCNPGGFINYMIFFYCDCQKVEPLGYIVLTIWLIALFYLLGNTAADYFCCSLEKLSTILKLSPTVAGATLLPLGNGAPDVFASIAAFVGRDSGEVGLNSVLGGAVFVTCVVVGAVSLSVAGKDVKIDKKCFFRDVGFFLIALVSLFIILVVGEVSVAGAIAFVSVYVVYALCVGIGELVRKHGQGLRLNLLVPLLPVTESVSSGGGNVDEELSIVDFEDSVPHLESKLPHWMWASNVVIYSNEFGKTSDDGEDPKCYLWGWKEEEDRSEKRSCLSCSNLCFMLEFPLAIPRRVTIPIVEEDRWSKKYAVASALFAPLLLSILWGGFYLIGAVVGCTLGLLALVCTEPDRPPRKFLLPWVLGGFLMSIVWFYIIANELVALLVTFGVMLKIKPSVLALTVLAWGNSMGDLMSNVAIALGGSHGVQIAVSGSYAGPMFNTLVGLGMSLLLGAWFKRPGCYVIPRDWSLYSTLGFLMLGLVWALVMVPRNGMKLGKVLGVGLIAIYVGFLVFRATVAVGEGTLDGSS